MRNYYVPGDWNATCDRCGFAHKASKLRLEWTGLRVCADTCWEPRHPQTLIRVPQEDVTVEWARPNPDTTYYTVDRTAVDNALIDAQVGVNPGSAIFNATPIPGSPRVFGDISNSQTASRRVTVLDINLWRVWSGVQTTPTLGQLEAAYCLWLEQYMIANPSTYSAYLILNTYSP